jgi:hypothetical protein
MAGIPWFSLSRWTLLNEVSQSVSQSLYLCVLILQESHAELYNFYFNCLNIKEFKLKPLHRFGYASYMGWTGIAHSVQRLATGWTIGWSRFDSRRGLWISLFDTVSRPALRPTQPPNRRAPGTLSLMVKRSGREADHSPPSTAEVKECVEQYLHSRNTPLWRGA